MKFKFSFVPLAIFYFLFGALFAFFYFNLTLSDFTEFSIKIRDVRGQKTFSLPAQQTYLLKVWGDDIFEKVYFNGSPLTHNVYRPREIIKEFYYLLPFEITRKDDNILTTLPVKRCTFSLKNNLAATGFGAIVFRSSRVEKIKATLNTNFFFVFWFSMFGLSFYYLSFRFFNISFQKFFIIQFLSFLPCLLFLYSMHKFNEIFSINFYFIGGSYFGFCAFLILIFQLPFLFTELVKEVKTTIKVLSVNTVNVGTAAPVQNTVNKFESPLVEPGHLLSKTSIKIAEGGKKITKQLIGHRIVKWFLAREFADKCIILFMFLLFFCAFLLTFKLDFFASFFANIAYLALITAVILKLKT